MYSCYVFCLGVWYYLSLLVPTQKSCTPWSGDLKLFETGSIILKNPGNEMCLSMRIFNVECFVDISQKIILFSIYSIFDILCTNFLICVEHVSITILDSFYFVVSSFAYIFKIYNECVLSFLVHIDMFPNMTKFISKSNCEI